MKTWNNPGLSVRPKAHIFGDREIDSMHYLKSLGDKNEFFI